MRPDSIRKFDMLYLATIALGIISAVLAYGDASVLIDAQMAEAGLEGMGTGVLIGSLLFGLAISVGLWFLVSRKRIEFVKWILLLLVIWNLASIPSAIAAGLGTVPLLAVLSTVLQAAAVYFLFRPDAKAWFAEKAG